MNSRIIHLFLSLVSGRFQKHRARTVDADQSDFQSESKSATFDWTGFKSFESKVISIHLSVRWAASKASAADHEWNAEHALSTHAYSPTECPAYGSVRYRRPVCAHWPSTVVWSVQSRCIFRTATLALDCHSCLCSDAKLCRPKPERLLSDVHTQSKQCAFVTVDDQATLRRVAAAKFEQEECWIQSGWAWINQDGDRSECRVAQNF